MVGLVDKGTGNLCTNIITDGEYINNNVVRFSIIIKFLFQCILTPECYVNVLLSLTLLGTSTSSQSHPS